MENAPALSLHEPNTLCMCVLILMSFLGILDMRSTLVGVIRVDPAELLEEGLLKELDRHISKKFAEFLEPQTKKPLSSSNNLLPRLQKLAESMDGYKRSLEYIQDYINIHGLRIWQKQVPTKI